VGIQTQIRRRSLNLIDVGISLAFKKLGRSDGCETMRAAPYAQRANKSKPHMHSIIERAADDSH
jgi:hypothetical protein